MSQRDTTNSMRTGDWAATVLEWLGEKALWVGGGITVIGIAGLIFYAFKFSSGGYLEKELATANNYIEVLQKMLVAGVLVFALGMTARFWSDIALPLTLFVLAVALFTATWWMEALTGQAGSSENLAVASKAIASLSLAGMYLGAYAIILQVIDAYARVKFRVIYGSKGDLVKYGKGVKEESDYRNVFMGKCWQLPFCRKFVREQCPIYHSRRTCWRERVGCMCEEEVIRGAMEGKIIPKDAVAAAKFIPYNMKLPPSHKAERCRQCIIYNEHQKHKYKLMVPVVFVAVGLFYFGLHAQLLESSGRLIQKFDTSMNKFTFSAGGDLAHDVSLGPGNGILEEIFLFCIMMFVLSQLLKLVEFCVFRLKI
jgi:hypothetical protein